MTESKRFKREHTLLEQLSNELLIEIFDYLNGVDTIHAFSQLNNRFHSLINNHVNIFNFKSINKVKFDYVIGNHDVHQWRSLCLSDNDETPGQIRLFCKLFPPEQYISQLQSLCALNMKPTYARRFLSQLVSFDHLISLTIGTICGEMIKPFKLPLLKKLVVTACKRTDWMMSFGQLKSLDYSVKDNPCCYQHLLKLPRTLKQLKLLYDNENVEEVQNAICNLSQLTKLVLYDNGNYKPVPNGSQWENLIRSSLPLLKTFVFCFRFHCFNGTSDDIKQAIDSFSTPFYVSKKRWFIRCDPDIQYGPKGILYTLPFAFADMPIDTTLLDTSISTFNGNGIEEVKFNSYENVTTLIFNETCRIPYRGLLASNIVRLVLRNTPHTSWTFLLYNIRHLEFIVPGTMSSTDFVQFLIYTPQLQSLTLPTLVLNELTDKFTNKTVCDQLSQKIQSLATYGRNFYNDEDIVNVCFVSSLVSIFGKNCEHLLLELSMHPNIVLPILQRMQQLRSLHIHCPSSDDTSSVTAASWLEQTRLQSHVSDFRHAPDNNNFYIWFGNRP